MCLYSKQILPRRATKDIIVYKEMVRIQYTDVYKTPFLDYKITLKDFGHIKSAGRVKSVARYSSIVRFRTEIGNGYFHCFRKFPLTPGIGRYGNYSINDNKVKYSTQWRVIECVIPKGNLYWIGINNDICSDKLIFNKILSEEEINQILYNNEKALTNRMLISTK